MIVPNETKRRLVVSYGAFDVYYDPLAHRPWGLFRIYRKGKYCGAQISYPSAADCELAGVVIKPVNSDPLIQYSETPVWMLRKPKGRPRREDSDRELREAMES